MNFKFDTGEKVVFEGVSTGARQDAVVRYRYMSSTGPRYVVYLPMLGFEAPATETMLHRARPTLRTEAHAMARTWGRLESGRAPRGTVIIDSDDEVWKKALSTENGGSVWQRCGDSTSYGDGQVRWPVATLAAPFDIGDGKR